jgi:glycosyltransferase involved in cell wall biosynthesis
MQLRKHKKTILSLGVKHAFVQAPEALCAIEKWGLSSICCYSAGLTNPLTMPRYRWGKLLARPFMRWWVSALAKCDVTLAAASQTEIDIFIVNSGRKLAKGKIISLPTRVDTSLFRPMDKTLIRQELGIARDDTVIANCGRINVVKGWELLVESCRVLLRRDCKVRLVFIGDGDDRQKLDKYVCKCGLSARVTVTGYLSAEEVAKYLNAADVIAVASFHEGWSVSMLEALACGKAIVSTDVSGARDMIVDGANGFIVATRDPESFADAITRAVALDNVHRVSLAMAEKYTLKNLGRELGRLWEPLS